MVIQNEYETGDIEDMKKSCVIYDSWAELIGNLPDEMAGQLMKMVLGYAFNGKQETCDDPAITAMFAMIKNKIDEDADAWNEECKRRSEAGKKGMASRWNNRAITNDNTVITEDNTLIKENNTVITNDNSEYQTVTNITDSEYVSEYESDNKKDILSDAVKRIVDHLNEKAGTKYKSNSKATSSQIKARLAEGYTVEDFLIVIDKKVKAWKDDPKMSQYLRPETLFRPGHFESYLNELEVDKESPPNKSNDFGDMSQGTYNKIHNYSERKIDYAELEAMVGL